MKRFSHKLIVILTACAAFIGGAVFDHYTFTNVPLQITEKLFPIRQSGVTTTHLTNPLLECAEFPEGFTIGDRVTLEKKTEEFIAEQKTGGNIASASVYFRDLNNGPWFGVGEETKFTPASLLKVPLAISFYKRAQVEPEILMRQIQYEKGNENYEASQPYGPNTALENEKIYTISDLLGLMLRESSNEAALLLAQIAGEDQIRSVYRDFGQVEPLAYNDLEIDVRTFASFFRILYNATYLNRLQSEIVLNELRQSTFKEGLVAGVPSDVVVAHKFGTRAFDGTHVQLHDCGIVYAKDRPYILCVMTQGDDFSGLSAFIKEVSSRVYSEISSQTP